ncbi:RNA-binding protein 14-like [Crotalus adamanteus]|uniref:RNA-binding protein 14-like n=1 Tax=Crotalus adamanteus TaxID=8729 RepID=A0AAW1BTE3_CROAD
MPRGMLWAQMLHMRNGVPCKASESGRMLQLTLEHLIIPRSQLTRQVTRGRRTVAGGGLRLFCGRHFVGPCRLASFLLSGPPWNGWARCSQVWRCSWMACPGGAPRVKLRDLFEVAVPGVVVKVALMKQFAFIQLCDKVAAECAIQKLNGHLLHCHHAVMEFSRPMPTHTVKTFVGNVSAACTSGELCVLFQEFGPVIECHIVKGVAVGVGGRTEIHP